MSPWQASPTGPSSGSRHCNHKRQASTYPTEPSLLQSCRPERPCHSPLPHVPCTQITLDTLVPSAYSHYLSAPLLRPSFDWKVQPHPLGSVHTHRLPLSISRAPAPHSGPPQCPAVTSESASNTRICNCNCGHLQLEGRLDGGALTPDWTFPLLPTLLAEPPFCSADPLLPGPGSEGSLGPRV